LDQLDLPSEIFDAQTNIPLIHQVVTAQLAKLLAREHRRQRTVVKHLVQERSLSSRREQAVHVRDLFALRYNAAVVQHTLFAHVHTSNAHQRR
jgi:hypothetical protein